jgi:PPP family 3-phenylpropionic acid transporter
VGQLLHAISYGLFYPAAIAFISLKTPPSDRATGIALLLGLGIGLPFFLGSTFGGIIVEFLGYRWLFAIFSLFSVASIILYRCKGKHLKTIR